MWSLVALDRWSFYTVTIAWDSALFVLDELSSYKGGRLNRFDYTTLLKMTPFSSIAGEKTSNSGWLLLVFANNSFQL